MQNKRNKRVRIALSNCMVSVSRQSVCLSVRLLVTRLPHPTTHRAANVSVLDMTSVLFVPSVQGPQYTKLLAVTVAGMGNEVSKWS